MESQYITLLKKSFYEIMKVYKSSHNFPLHIHNKICVGKIDSGEKILFINGKYQALRKNDLFYIPPYIPHGCYVKDGNTVSYTVLCIDDMRNISEKKITNDLFRLPIETKDICTLYRFAKSKTSNVNCNDSSLEKVIQYIDHNYASSLSVDLLAEEAGLNCYYLLHLFKEKVGLSLHQYIIQTRIKKIKEYYYTSSSILEAALACGFFDQSHFIKHFKRHIGVTPKIFFSSITIL